MLPRFARPDKQVAAGHRTGVVSARTLLDECHCPASAAATLAVSMFLQSVLIALCLRVREPGQPGAVMREWRRSLLPGLTGAAAAACWFSAMAIEAAAYLRMLGLVEVLFGYGVSIFALGQRPARREQPGTGILVVEIVGLLWGRAG